MTSLRCGVRTLHQATASQMTGCTVTHPTAHILDVMVLSHNHHHGLPAHHILIFKITAEGKLDGQPINSGDTVTFTTKYYGFNLPLLTI